MTLTRPAPSEYAGQLALVTGATSGIGRAVALSLAHAGATVIVHGRDSERGAQVVGEIEAEGGRARLITADVAQPEEARRLASEAGQVDILINNAGMYRFTSTAETSDELFDRHINTNLKATFILVRELAPAMAARGRGAIVNLSTVGASASGGGAGIYGASKAALENLTLTWADEFGGRGVRVNAVSAGPTRTPGTAIFGEVVDRLGRAFVQGRVGEAAEVAEAVLFLVSARASYINGAVLQVHGGIRAITPVS